MNPVIDKIQKLLSKTVANGCSEAEAASAYQMASRLLAEHNLTVAEVEAKEEGQERWIKDVVTDSGRIGNIYHYASMICKEFFFVQTVISGGKDPNTGKRRFQLIFFGKADNVDVAKQIYKSLLDEFEFLWGCYRIYNRAPLSEKEPFILGVKDGFRNKLRSERDALRQSKGTELALIETKLDRAFRGAFSILEKGKTIQPRNYSRDAYGAGYNQGQRLNLHQKKLGN